MPETIRIFYLFAVLPLPPCKTSLLNGHSYVIHRNEMENSGNHGDHLESLSLLIPPLPYFFVLVVVVPQGYSFYLFSAVSCVETQYSWPL
ncbi:hypothetical protein CEXT_316471 [Caerostris extrusa]|uniref:Uncharacterized protein n=1 Tax=Caerostris extrusa TaxID=172846 RepID=A0AAV4VKY2_CAEEX|nr:hypothetical protein CEXT_316471 [Caerostris extrusa]